MIRVGWGYDIHRLILGAPLVLGGVDFPDAPKGFQTHSDGDVVAHAAIDALCGGLGLGSLGDHFPEDDPADQNARSIGFLARFRPQLDAAQARVLNLDVTVFAAKVRIAPQATEMRRHIAEGLGISVAAVNVKGKTREGFGPEGRDEAISATVVATLEVPDA